MSTAASTSLCFFCVLLLQHSVWRPALAALVCAPSMACFALRSATGTWLAPARLPGAVRRGWRTGLDASMRFLSSPSMARQLRRVHELRAGYCMASAAPWPRAEKQSHQQKHALPTFSF